MSQQRKTNRKKKRKKRRKTFEQQFTINQTKKMFKIYAQDLILHPKCNIMVEEFKQFQLEYATRLTECFKVMSYLEYKRISGKISLIIM